MKCRSSQMVAASAVPVLLAIAVGCAQTPNTAPAKVSTQTTLRATATLHWNEYARELIARNSPGQAPAARMFAYLTLAQHNATVRARQLGRNVDGAVAGTSATVLAFFFPNSAQAIDAHLSRESAALGAGGPRGDFLAGVEVGKRVADDVIAGSRSEHPWSMDEPGEAAAAPGVSTARRNASIFLGERQRVQGAAARTRV